MTSVKAVAEPVVVTVNGREREVRAGTTVAGLLQSLAINPQMVVVELNREILRDGALHPQRVLGTGDSVEIVHFVGGG